MSQPTFIILGLVAVIQLMLLSVFLFSHKKGNRLGHGLLGVFLLSNALVIADVLQYMSGFYIQFPYLLFSGFALISLYGPLLFLFTLSVIRPDFVLRKQHLFHLVPFAVYWSIYFILFAPAGNIKEQALAFIGAPVMQAFYLFLHLQILAYVLISLVRIRMYTKRNQEAMKSRNKPFGLQLPWLRIILWGFLLMWLGDLVMLIMANYTEVLVTLHAGFNALALVLYFVFVNVAVFLSLKRPEIFDEIKPKYAQSALTAKKARILVESLVEYFERDKPYLNPDLSLQEVAEHLSTQSRYVSQVINESFGHNFSDFINTYRIDAAKQLLSEGNDSDKTILEIVFETGFNSKSAFHSAFKKITGVTPTDFRSGILRSGKKT